MSYIDLLPVCYLLPTFQTVASCLRSSNSSGLIDLHVNIKASSRNQLGFKTEVEL